MSAGESTVAARVPAEFRAEIERRVEELRAAGVHYPDGREVDLSYVLRVGLRHYLDGDGSTVIRLDAGRFFGEASAIQGDRLGNLNREPASHAGDPGTSRAAARNAWPRANSDRHRALDLLFAAGARGMTGDELDIELGGYNGRRRLSDLKAAGYVHVKRERSKLAQATGGAITNAQRKTRTGAWADVYVLSAEAEVRVRDERKAGGRGATDG